MRQPSEMSFSMQKSQSKGITTKSCRCLLGLVIVVLLVALASLPALAQDFTAFFGTVKDQSGAVLPGATVQIKEEKTGFTASTTTNDTGEFTFQGIPSGTYTIQANHNGFKKYMDTDVIVYARVPRRVDVTLQTGSVEQAVTVEAEGSTIARDTAAITYKVPNKELYALNIPGYLIFRVDLNPGSEVRSQVHGGNANNTSAEQDGIATNAYGDYRAPQELEQQINTISVNAPAEYRTSANIEGISKGGTNRLHGEVFVNLSNPALNALPGGVRVRPKPETTAKQWSFDFSGPVYIPKIYDGRNKTFFRFLYQPLSSQLITPINDFILPTAAMRNGDVSEYATFTGKLIIDPLTGLPFPNNQIPLNRISPVAQNILKLLPMPTLNTVLQPNYSVLQNSSNKANWKHFRIDQNLGSGSLLSISHVRFDNNSRQVWPAPLLGGQENVAASRSWTVDFSHVFSPRIVNEFSYGYINEHKHADDLASDGSLENGAAVLQQFGITNFGGRTITSTQGGGPFFQVQTLGQQSGIFAGAFNGIAANLIGSNGPVGATARDEDHVYQVRNNLSWQKGVHVFKMGVEVRKQVPNTLSAPPGSWGNFNFTGNFTHYDFADFFLGLPNTTSLTGSRPEVQNREWEVGFFFQDDWKITPKLTLTPGIRFEHYGVPIDATGLYYNFDLANLSVIVPDQKALAAVNPSYPQAIPILTASQAGYPSSLANFKALLWEPRFGFAWQPWGPTFVVRGGYGIYHVPYEAPAGDTSGSQIGGPLAGRDGGPFALSESFGPNQIINGQPTFSLSSPFPGGPGKVGLQTVYYLPVNSRANAWPYDQQWNLTLERELPLHFAGRVSYVGSQGVDLPYTQNLQIPQPSTIPFTPARRPYGSSVFSSINNEGLGGSSSYNGLEVELDRQFSDGLYFRGWYDHRKSLNNVQGGLFGGVAGQSIENPYDLNREWGWQDGLPSDHGNLAVVYPLPFGRGRLFLSNAPGWINHIFGDWTIASDLTFSWNTHFTPVFSGADPANVGVSSGLRPDALCDPNNFGSTPGTLWNRACFAVPSSGRYGTASRGMLEGPYVWNVNYNMFKAWHLTGKENGPYFKLEFYSNDIFNHANTESPDSLDISSPRFGVFRPASSEFRQLTFRARIGF